MRRSLSLALVAAAAAVTTTLSWPASAAIPLPTSMASTGDSITRGYDATGNGCFLVDCPQYSWSTGTDAGVNSHYSRISTASTSPVTAYNDAKTGAKMIDLDGQVKTAATQGVQYLTVLMGANDVCTSSISTMTSTATLQSQFQTALTDFFAANPSSHVFVSSIPNIYQLWSLLHTNPSAANTWNYFKICQSMLATTNTEAQRQQVVAQEQADNNALATVCAQFANCLWDKLATYNYTFTTTDVSTVDYFHPSPSGQANLAATTWAASYWPTL